MYNCDFDKIYLINGLSRSGNHLFITWLISAFEDNSVYFLNNVYPKQHLSIYSNNQLNIDTLMKNSVATIDGDDQGKYIEEEDIRKKLVKKEDMKNMLEGKIKKAQVLILSIENNFVNILDMVGALFKKYNHMFKVIILRDVLNLFASRFEAETKLIKNIKKNDPDFKWHIYETDIITFGYYINNLMEYNKPNYISYLYNQFIMDENYKKNLAHMLQIDYNKAMVTKSKFLKGSSFQNNANETIEKYFMRWYLYRNNKYIQFFMNDDYLMKLMKTIFDFSLQKNSLKVKNISISFKNYENKLKSNSKKSNSKKSNSKKSNSKKSNSKKSNSKKLVSKK